MTDYIGKYVKRFESGTKGSLAFSNCGNDWGLSCGSYQLTLRWGNCINFLKKYFPTESRALYFNNLGDITTKNYPGKRYCSSPEAVKSVWQLCYNKVGAEKFFEYEHAHIKATYYDRILPKIKNILDVEALNDRAFKECFWSWGVHKGVTGAVKQFEEVITENKLTDLRFVDKEELFDLIYDKRYQINPCNRYKKGLKINSERELLRPLLTKGTISGELKEVYEKEQNQSFIKEMEDISNSIDKIDGIGKIIYRKSDGVNIREYPSFDSNVLDVYTYGKEFNIVGITKDKKFYKLHNNTWVSANTNYVLFTPKKVNELLELYKVRIEKPEIPFYKEPDSSSKVVGLVKKNQVFTIVCEQNGFGRLRSGAGWLPINSDIKKL